MNELCIEKEIKVRKKVNDDVKIVKKKSNEREYGNKI